MKKLLLLFAFFFYNFTIGQSIISVTPSSGNRGQNLQVTITGQDVNFYDTSSTLHVTFIDQYNNILPGTSLYTSFPNNVLYINLALPGYAIPGWYNVNVYDTNGAFDITYANGFLVNNAYTYTIQGNVRYDSNGNGCDASDINLPNQRITFTNGSNIGNFIGNQSGFYSYYDVNAGNNSFSPVMENPSYFTITPPSASVALSSSNPLFIQDFCVAPNGTHNDLQISLIPVSSARPGFNATYKLVYKNSGTNVQNGSVDFTFDDNVMDLVSSTPTFDSQGTNTLSWNFSNLLPFERREILVTMNINSPTETPPVNAGNILVFNATVTGATDQTPTNNNSHINQTVVSSFDPNDKTCTEGPSLPISEVGKYLNYVIRFENTGTANAENIVVKDIIDTTKFDISTLTPISGSASFTTRILNTNQVEFIFENINLPFDDANNDGYVAFKIKTKPTLTVGTNINNTANIFFDYNAPITTNTYTVTVFNPLSTNDFEFGNLFTISPVPAKNNLNITIKSPVTVTAINIYNTLGQLVKSTENNFESIDVSGLKTGNYFIQITSDKGTTSSKFIKE